MAFAWTQADDTGNYGVSRMDLMGLGTVGPIVTAIGPNVFVQVHYQLDSDGLHGPRTTWLLAAVNQCSDYFRAMLDKALGMPAATPEAVPPPFRGQYIANFNGPTSNIQVTLCSANSAHSAFIRGPGMPYVRCGGYNSMVVMFQHWAHFRANVNLLHAQLLQASQSDDDYNLVEVQIMFMMPLPAGGGLLSKKCRVSNTRRLHYELGGTHIWGEDDYMCAARALVFLDFHMASKSNEDADLKKWRLVSAGHIHSQDSKAGRLLKKEATQLCIDAQIPTDRPVSYSDLWILAQTLSRMRHNNIPCHIQVFQGFKLQFCTLNTEEGQLMDPEDFAKIRWYNLVLQNNHYSAVTRIHRFLRQSKYYCYRCKKTYSNKNHHRCSRKDCTMCFSHDTDHFQLYKDSKDGSEWIRCTDCGCNYYSQDCYNTHKEARAKIGYTRCQERWTCADCKKTFFHTEIMMSDGRLHTRKARANIQDPEDHCCGSSWCDNCQKNTDEPTHQCYMEPLDQPTEHNQKYLFADFESTQETGVHHVNLIVTQTYDGEFLPHHTRVKPWLDMLVETKEFWGSTVIFHNGKGYDFQFIVKTVMNRTDKQWHVSPVMIGTKILYFILKESARSRSKWIRFVDSLNFLPMALAKFTKAFGLTAKKGFYPHLFNTRENYHYRGPMPEEKFFCTQDMDPTTYETWQEWYREKIAENYVWDNQTELLEYCKADVNLLRQGCRLFQQTLVQNLNHDPFQSITLAGSAMAIWRSNFLQRETVAAFSAQQIRRWKPALAGGRTGPTKLLEQVSGPEERILYADFTSLYPYVNKYGQYPVGHPDIHWTEFDLPTEPPSLEILGIWEVDVRCPPDLYHPVLHSKDPETGLLLFDLRPKQKHMYTNLELKYALEKGYSITKTYEVWGWSNTTQGIFAPYIDFFLKMKQQAAGYPLDCDEKKYIQDYKNKEGIELDPQQIENNPCMYLVAKLYLNSLWGKCGQRLSEEFDTTALYHDNLQDGSRLAKQRAETDNIKSITILSPTSVAVNSQSAKLPDTKRIGTQNLPIAIFTTAQARLKLLKVLHFLDHAVMYYDTDSIIFKWPTADLPILDQKLPLGKFLGDLTNELGHDKYSWNSDDWITKFCSGGPKHYGYVTAKGMDQVKVKGLHLKGRLLRKFITYESVFNIVTQQNLNYAIHNPQIARRGDFTVFNRDQAYKIYRSFYRKRRILAPTRDYFIDTVPWTPEYDAELSSTLGTNLITHIKPKPCEYLVILKKDLTRECIQSQELKHLNNCLMVITGFNDARDAEAYHLDVSQCNFAPNVSSYTKLQQVLVRTIYPLRLDPWKSYGSKLQITVWTRTHERMLLAWKHRANLLIINSRLLLLLLFLLVLAPRCCNFLKFCFVRKTTVNFIFVVLLNKFRISIRDSRFSSFPSRFLPT